MANVTVNISFQDSLLAEIDAVAGKESRSRSELLREAARSYIKRQKQWEALFALGDAISVREGLTETDIMNEIETARESKASRS